MVKDLIIKAFDGEGRVRDATFVEFERTFGKHRGHYRVQLADRPEAPFGELEWKRKWYQKVIEDSILLTHHSIRTPKMLFDNEDCDSIILKMDQQSLRKNYNRYGWYERVFVDKSGNVNEYEVEENGKTVTLEVPKLQETMKYRNLKTGAIEYELTHKYIADEALLKRAWTPVASKFVYIEYCIATEVWMCYARQFNTWHKEVRFLAEELGEEVSLSRND